VRYFCAPERELRGRAHSPAALPTRISRGIAATALGAALLVATGCSAPNDDHGALSVGDRSALSASGALRLTLTSAPEAMPVRGTNTIELEVTQVDTGAGVSDLKLALVPFMPAMGHGSGFTPRSSVLGDGRYRFDDVVLNMPGLWELRTTVEEPASDEATFRFDIK